MVEALREPSSEQDPWRRQECYRFDVLRIGRKDDVKVANGQQRAN